MKLSVIIPLYNEADSLDRLLNRTQESLDKLAISYEVIAVDDGSSDTTFDLLIAARSTFPELKVLQLSRNFGHQAAYTAGMNKSKGQYIALMDGDLQDPPELIGDMYHKISKEDLDVVYGKRVNVSHPKRRSVLAYSFHKLFKRLYPFVHGNG
mgnify:CR=1 FL=1